MRLLVVGRLNGQLSAAVKMAMEAGAKVAHVETIAAATQALPLVGTPGVDLVVATREGDANPVLARALGMLAALAR